MKPLGKNLIVLPYKEKLSKFIETPDNKEKAHIGTVVSVGPEAKDFQPKEKIIFNKHHATVVRYNGEELYIIDEENVYAKLQD